MVGLVGSGTGAASGSGAREFWTLLSDSTGLNPCGSRWHLEIAIPRQTIISEVAIYLGRYFLCSVRLRIL